MNLAFVFRSPERIFRWLALLALPSVIEAETAFTAPVGGAAVGAAANTDTILSVPLSRPAIWSGTVASGSGSSIVVLGSPSWAADAFAPAASRYARMLSGTLRGHYFVILANTSDTLSVDTAGLDLADLAAGDSMEIAPFWTLGALYPASDAGSSFVASESAVSRQTELHFHDATATGINRTANGVFYFYNGAWRKVGADEATSYDHTVVYPDAFFIQRNKAAATQLVVAGRVQPGYVSTILEAVDSTPNDNFVAVAHPVNLTLDETGLATAGFSASSSPLSVTDQLLWFDPAGTGINRSASAIYYYYNGGWRKKGASVAIDYGSSVVLTAGSGFIVRKAANGTSSAWVFGTGI